jgi:hypothetical protein
MPVTRDWWSRFIPGAVEYYVAVIQVLAKQLNHDVTALVLVANHRLSPTRGAFKRSERLTTKPPFCQKVCQDELTQVSNSWTGWTGTTC